MVVRVERGDDDVALRRGDQILEWRPARELGLDRLDAWKRLRDVGLADPIGWSFASSAATMMSRSAAATRSLNGVPRANSALTALTRGSASATSGSPIRSDGRSRRARRR